LTQAKCQGFSEWESAVQVVRGFKEAIEIAIAFQAKGKRDGARDQI
jgi:hypothetical protein